MGIFQKLAKIFRNRPGLYLTIIWVGLALGVALLCFGWFNDRIMAGVTVAEIKIGNIKTTAATQLLNRELLTLLKKKIVLNYKNRTLSVIPDAIGISIDIPATVKTGYAVGRSGPVWSRLFARLTVFRHGVKLNPVFKVNRETLVSFYRLLDAIIAVEPIRSVISVSENGRVSYSSSRVGQEIDHDLLTQLLEKAIISKHTGFIEIPVLKVEPPLTEKDIKKWGLDRVLGVYSTRFDPNQQERSENVKLACGAIDNSIVYPGQSFSFNTWVGPRVSESGYKEAPIIWFGKLIPGLGGGVCQVSTTLYNALLLANLKVVQRSNHSIPSVYVPLGRDATVSYGGIDLIFENNYRDPILLVARVDPPLVTVAVLGKNATWDQITLEAAVLETYPFEKKEIQDPFLPRGMKVKIQSGREGYKVELWRNILLKNGEVQKELINTSIYPAQVEEYKIGKPQTRSGRYGSGKL